MKVGLIEVEKESDVADRGVRVWRSCCSLLEVKVVESHGQRRQSRITAICMKVFTVR